MRANNIAAAIDLLNQAVGLDPADPQSQFQLGVALQAAGRHTEALARLKTAQALLADDAAPFLHAAVSHLALGDNPAALTAASEACWRAPKLAAAHYAYGQAWAALSETGRAEQAFAAAIQLSPRWADAWVNYGLARYRQGANRRRQGRHAAGASRRTEPRGRALQPRRLDADQRRIGRRRAASARER
jgi:tetratricopeptide (TPR) repeat protein